MRKTQNWLPGFIFNDFFDNDWSGTTRTNFSTPAVNVREDEKQYDVEMIAPGMTKNDFNIKIDENDTLSVVMEKKTENKDEDNKGRYLRHEFSYTQFSKNLILPDDADKAAISARIENGILTICIPKKEKQPAQTIQVVEVN